MEEGISHVPLVGQHILDRTAVPVSVSVPSWYAFLIEYVCDCLHSESLQVEAEYSAYYYRLGFVDNHLTVYEVEAVCGAGAVELAGLHPLLVAPTHIPRYVHAFLLRSHTGECYDHFHIQFVGVYALFLEIHADSEVCQHTQSYEQFFRVSRKSGYRLDDDAVDETFLTVTDQSVQLIALFHLGSRDTLVGIDVDKLVFGMLLGVVAVVPNLRGEGMELIGGIT